MRAKQHGHAQVERQDGEVAAPGGRPMAFEEKRRLSQGLGALAGDKLGVVMEIIAESQRYDSVRPALLSRRSLQAHKLGVVMKTIAESQRYNSVSPAGHLRLLCVMLPRAAWLFCGGPRTGRALTMDHYPALKYAP